MKKTLFASNESLQLFTKQADIQIVSQYRKITVTNGTKHFKGTTPQMRR